MPDVDRKRRANRSTTARRPPPVACDIRLRARQVRRRAGASQ
jgi:hypothetical protein